MNASKDKEARELVDAKNQAEQMVYQAESTLKEAGDKLPADVRGQIEAAIKEVKDKKNSDSLAEVKSSMEKLQKILGDMAQAAGAQAGAGPQAAQPEPQAEEPPKKDNGPIDAEYEVVDDDKKK
jgi:molecular chaperone DnaK